MWSIYSEITWSISTALGGQFIPRKGGQFHRFLHVRKNRHRDHEGIIKFGAKLRQIRKGKGITQEEHAHNADIHLSQIGRIERGEINTSISFAFLFAELLEVDPKVLFDYSDLK